MVCFAQIIPRNNAQLGLGRSEVDDELLAGIRWRSGRLQRSGFGALEKAGNLVYFLLE